MITDDHPGDIHRENRDGRVARGERTRRAIVEAHAALLRDGELRPTAKLVAARAGISVRTLWLNFGDMEALMSATSQDWLDRDLEHWEPVSPSLPLAQRIEQWCPRRGDRLEALAPAVAAGILFDPFSPSLGAARKQHVARLHRDLSYTFEGEIGDEEASTPQRLALVGAANSMTWLMYRRDQGLSVDEAIVVMSHTFTHVLDNSSARSSS